MRVRELIVVLIKQASEENIKSVIIVKVAYYLLILLGLFSEKGDIILLRYKIICNSFPHRLIEVVHTRSQ